MPRTQYLLSSTVSYFHPRIKPLYPKADGEEPVFDHHSTVLSNFHWPIGLVQPEATFVIINPAVKPTTPASTREHHLVDWLDSLVPIDFEGLPARSQDWVMHDELLILWYYGVWQNETLKLPESIVWSLCDP